MSELIKREDVQREIQANFDGCALGWQDWQDLMDRINALPAASPWHRVEEPPKDGQKVLTMDADEDMETATYDGDGFEDSYGFYVANVLYWMPIEPPKEEEHGN